MTTGYTCPFLPAFIMGAIVVLILLTLGDTLIEYVIQRCKND